MNRIDGNNVDIVLSEMTENMGGNHPFVQFRSIYLIELACDRCKGMLKKRGSIAVKVFQGKGFDQYLAVVKERFKIVKTRKPESFRTRSREVYLVASGFKL